MRALLRVLSALVGVVGSLVFVVAVLAAVAPPAASGVPSCAPVPGALFAPCARLDASRVSDLRTVLVGDPASSVYRCLVAAGFPLLDEVGSPVVVPRASLPGAPCGVRA